MDIVEQKLLEALAALGITFNPPASGADLIAPVMKKIHQLSDPNTGVFTDLVLTDLHVLNLLLQHLFFSTKP